MNKYLDYKLCYVDNVDDWNTFKLYFTSKFEDQWGDDWNDRPACCNAEPPYDDGRDIVTIYLELLGAGDITFGGKVYSVEDMNKKLACWLIYENVCLEGGDTLETILTKIKEHNKARNNKNIGIWIQYEEED